MSGMEGQLQFTIPACPVAQPRQRHRIVSSGGRRFVGNYTPKDSPANVFKATARLALEQVYRGDPIDEPIALDVLFVFPRPSNLRWKKRAMPRVPHASRPDVDNVLKCVLDALNGLLWIDDSRIAETILRKVIAAGDEQPHVVVSVTKLAKETA